MKYEYPMWFRDTVSQLVVKFDSLTSGVVVEDGIAHKVGYRSSEWINHNANCWENVTDQYKGKQMENNTIEINTTHTPIEELQQIILNGKTYNLVPVEETKPEEPTIEKWEPKGGEWFIDSDGAVRTGDSVDSYRLYGIERETIEQAQKASIEIRKHNRLLAWLAENDDGWEADWDDNGQPKYFIFCYNNDECDVLYHNAHNQLGCVYMSYSNAHKLADLLNKGIVEL